MNANADNSRLVRLAVTAVAVLVIGGGAWYLHKILKAPDQPRQIVHNISLIKQPPPPPPKPPEKPPEPPKIKEEVKIPQDQPKPAERQTDQKPAAEKPIGTDVPAGPGGTLGSNSGNGDGSAGGGPPGAYYTGLIQRQLHENLMRNKQLQRRNFKVVVQVEFNADGKLVHSDLVTSSGDKEIDQQIIAALADTPPLKDAPPPDLRDVEVRLSNHI